MTSGTPVDPKSKEFKQNAARLREQIERLRELQRSVVAPAADKHIERHRARGKLTARERVELLLDPGSPFLEIGMLAGLELYEGVRAGAGMITGVGRVHGREVMIIANDATVKGGTYFPMTVKKHLRAQEIALENHLPCVYLVDSGGAFLPMQDEVFPDRDHFGRIFYNQARMSALNIPQLSVVLGSCTAGGAYVPAMSDEAIIVQGEGTIFLGGPPLVKAATGEEVTPEELGGAEVHCKISGVTDHLAESERAALAKCRALIANLGRRSQRDADVQPARAPRLDPEELYGLVPADSRKYFPMREILARVLDNSELEEFKREYGTSIICGFARVEGHLIGILANDGILFSESALKATHFIQLCNQRAIPLVFFQNITGFMVGKEYERRGLAKDGAKMVTAVACSRVPKFTVVVGGSYGAGNYGMAGRAYQPRTLFMWPNARISVMGAEQAASVLTQVRGDSGKGAESKQNLERYRKEILERYERQSAAWYSTARLWDDGVIDPVDTRRVLGLSLGMSLNAPLDELRYGVLRT